MLVVCIILVVLLLLFILPVGVDVAYADERFTLKAKVGPLRFGILPAKKKKPKPETEKPPKPSDEEKPEEQKKDKPKLGLSDILDLVKIALRALSRFRKCLSVDQFTLYFVAAALNPYDAVMQYGYLNAGLSSLDPLVRRILHIRKSDVRTAVDFDREQAMIELRLILTIQIWELLYLGITVGFSLLRWIIRRKRAEKSGNHQTVEQKG